MWPFRPSNIPEDEVIDWIHTTTAWFLVNTGGLAQMMESQLVLPTKDYFPASKDLLDEELSLVLFEQVRDYAGMRDWPCRLVAQEREASTSELMPGYAFGTGAPPTYPLGTFSADKKGVVEISYDPKQLQEPEGLVATLAHELAHYLIATFQGQVPGGGDNREYATDLAAVMMGFGVILANSAFKFSQFTDLHTHGWSTSARGYLSELDLSYALALYIVLTDRDPKDATTHLRTNPASYVRTAYRYITKKQVMAVNELREKG